MSDFLVTYRTKDFEYFAACWKLASTGIFVSFERLHEFQFIARVIPFACRRVNLFAFGGFVVGSIGGRFEHFLDGTLARGHEGWQ
ncbi:MAG: hypothetical protein RJB11_2511 [Planctomycetota bacterium]